MTELVITPELLIRPLGIDDAPMLFARIEANRAILRQWLPWLDQHRLPVDSKAYIGLKKQAETVLTSVTRGIWYQQVLCGVIELHAIQPNHRKTELGYWLDQAHYGKGIMTRSVRSMVDYAFDVLNLNRVEIRCADQNHPSRRIPERLNFTYEGTIRDAEWLYEHFVDNRIYGMLARDWTPH